MYPTLSDNKTTYRISSRSYDRFGRLDTFVGRVRWYKNGQPLWSESTGIHRLTAEAAQEDAQELADSRRF